MTVKCISMHEQCYIVDAFLAKTQTLNQLAHNFGVSRRTLIRVLEDAGVNPGVKHRFPQPKTVDIPLTFPTEQLPIPYTQNHWSEPLAAAPWYTRVLKFVGLRA